MIKPAVKMALSMVLSEAPVGIAAAAGVISDHDVGFLSLLAAGVGAVITSLTWFDARMDKKIAAQAVQDCLRYKAHEEADEERHRAIRESVQDRHDELMREIKHLRELLALDGSIPGVTPIPRHRDRGQ